VFKVAGLAASSLAVLSGLAWAGASPAPAGEIAYSAASDQTIHVVHTDGTNDRVLYSRAIYPAWSPDGAKLWVAGVGAGFAPLTVASDGVVQPIYFDQPLVIPQGPASWSPDGKQFVLSASPDAAGNETNLYVVGANGSGVRQLTSGYVARDPKWSPDGQWIVFVRSLDGQSLLYLIHPDGTGLQPMLPHAGAGGFAPAWSPDGRRIAFARDGIFVATLSTGLQQPLTSGPVDRNPAWSPDGQWIAFTTGTQQREIDLIRSDGSDRRPVVISPTSVGYPSWRPIAPALRLLTHGVDDFWPRRPFTITSTVTSVGAAPITHVSLRATIRGAARIVKITSKSSTCTSSYLGQLRATCGLGDLQPAAFRVIYLRIRPLRPGKITINLAASTTSNELDRSDNTLTLHTVVTR
jgi:TolB protein